MGSRISIVTAYPVCACTVPASHTVRQRPRVVYVTPDGDSSLVREGQQRICLGFDMILGTCEGLFIRNRRRLGFPTR